MNGDQHPRATHYDAYIPVSRLLLLCSCAALFLLVMGAKLWLIRDFGSDLPYWDQWNGEAGNVFIPWFNGSLAIGDLFKPHNEHRIFFSRLLSLGLVLLNGQWDARLGMAVNSAIHSLSAVLLFWVMIRLAGRRFLIPGLPAAALVFALPFSWENTLSAFQSQFYLLLLFSFLAIGLLTVGRPPRLQWFAGLIAALAAIFTMASGFLALCALALVAALKIAVHRQSWKPVLATLAAASFLVLFGALMSVSVDGHEIFRARSPAAFLMALGRNLAWPNTDCPWLALLNVLPLVLLFICYVMDRRSGARGEEFALAFGAWIILQAAATAYARGGSGHAEIAPRYMDLLSLGLVVNVFVFVLMDSRMSARKRIRSAWRAFIILWAVVVCIGLFKLTSHALNSQIPAKKASSDLQLANVRAFLATDDIRNLEGKAAHAIPFPCPYYLARILRDPLIVPLLPAGARRPLKVTANDADTSGFAKSGIPSSIPTPETFETIWGSWNADTGGGIGFFRSLPIPKPRLPYLRFQVAGSLPETELELKPVVLSDGGELILRPARSTDSEWLPVVTRSPPGEFMVVASDQREDGWLAFSEPVELGSLSRFAEQLADAGPRLLAAGLILTTAIIFMAARFSRSGTSGNAPALTRP